MRMPEDKVVATEEIKVVTAKVIKPTTKALPVPKDIVLDTTGTVTVGRMVIVDKLIVVPDEKTVLDSMGCTKEDAVFLINSIVEVNEEIKKKTLVGKVIVIEGDYLTVDLGKEYPFTQPLNDVVNYKETFLLVSKENVSLIKQSEDEVAHGVLYEFFSEGKLDKISEESRQIISLKSEVLSHESDIASYIRSVNDYKKTIVNKMMLIKNKSLSLEKAIEGTEEDTSEIYYKNIFKNPDVKELSVVDYRGETCLLLTTNELMYKSKKRKDLTFNIGGFKVLFMANGSIMASNYTKIYSGGDNHHPCISSNFSVCMGNAFKSALSQAIKGNDYASAIHMTIDFLKEPDYGEPFIEDINLISMQPIKKSPKTEIGWFDQQFFRELPWDNAKYRVEQGKALDKIGGITHDNDGEDEYNDDDDSDDGDGDDN